MRRQRRYVRRIGRPVLRNPVFLESAKSVTHLEGFTMGRTCLLALAGLMALGFVANALAVDITVCKNPAECSVHGP